MYDHVDDDDHDDDDDDDDGDDDDDCVRMKILQTMMLWKLMWRRRADPTTGSRNAFQNCTRAMSCRQSLATCRGPRPGGHTLSEPAQPKCAWTLHKGHAGI